MKHIYTLPQVPYVTATTMPIGSNEYLLTGVEVLARLRGQGHARSIMKLVIEDADASGVTLHLQVNPDHSPRSLSDEQLINWYSRLGFAQVIDPDDHLALTRMPRPGATLA